MRVAVRTVAQVTRHASLGRFPPNRAEVVEELAVRRQYHVGALARKRRLVGLHGAVEVEEALILTEGVVQNLGADRLAGAAFEEPLLDDYGRCCRAAGVCLWLQADLQSPKFEVRFAPNKRTRA